MLPLKAAIKQAEARGSTCERGGSLVHARDGRSVVASGDDGAVGCRQGGCDDVQVADHTSLFQVTVSEGTIGVVGRDQASLNLRREGLVPEAGLLVGGEEDSSQALFAASVVPTHDGAWGTISAR